MNAHDMVQHSFWHQRVQLAGAVSACPVCRGPVEFVLRPEIGWLCPKGHPVHTPIYIFPAPQSCPFPALHTNPTL